MSSIPPIAQAHGNADGESRGQPGGQPAPGGSVAGLAAEPAVRSAPGGPATLVVATPGTLGGPPGPLPERLAEGGRAGLGRAAALVALVVLLAVAGLVIPLLGPSLALHGTGEAAPPGAGGIAALRVVLFAALCVPVGEVFGWWLTRRVPGAPTARTPPSRVAVAAAAGFLAALGLASVVSTGNLVPDRLSDVDIPGLYRTRDGVLALVELNGFLLAGLWAGGRHMVGRVLPPATIIAAEALRAHPTIESAPLAGSALTAVHLTCAVLWAGGLWQVLRIVRLWRRPAPPVPTTSLGPTAPVGSTAPLGPTAPSGSIAAHGLAAVNRSAAPHRSTDRPGSAAPSRAGPAMAAALLARYARVAAALLAVLTATGVISAVRRMPLDTLLGQLVTTAYGRTLLAKVLLVAVAAALALGARLRLDIPSRIWPPARRRERARSSRLVPPGGLLDPLGACSPARAELVALVVVVALSALLTALPVPIRW